MMSNNPQITIDWETADRIARLSLIEYYWEIMVDNEEIDDELKKSFLCVIKCYSSHEEYEEFLKEVHGEKV